MQNLREKFRNNGKNIFISILWSLLLFFITKDEIIKLFMLGKNFSGRSFYVQVIIASVIIIIYFTIILLINYLLTHSSTLLPLSEGKVKNFIVNATEKITVIFTPIIQLTTMLWLIAFLYIPRGFDITDGGYYLLIAHRFEDVSYEIRQFGLFTRIIYLVAGESAGLMRIYGAILLIGVSLACGWTIARLNKTYSTREKTLFLAIPTISILMIYRQWISTPNYNWLALISGLLFLTGLLIFASDSRKSFFWGGFIIGNSLFIAFFAKPSTAVCLFVVMIISLIIEPKKITYLLDAIKGGLVSLLLGIAVIYLSGQTIPGFIQKFVGGYQAISLFEHSANQIFSPLGDYLKYLFLYYWWIWILFLILILGSKLLHKYIPFIAKVNIDIIFVGIWGLCLLFLALYLDPGIWAGFLFGLTFEFLLLVFLIYPKNAFETASIRKSLLRSFYALLTAYSIVFGSIDGYVWHFANILCVFVISQLFLLESLPQNLIKKSQYGLAILLLIGIPYIVFFKPTNSWKPHIYGQDIEVWQMEENVSIRFGKEAIFTSPKYAKVFIKLQNDAAANGFVVGTPIIDLTGASPGLVYVLDGRSPIYPWYAGGYQNSDKFVRNILNEWLISDLQKAWIFTSDGPRKISTTLLNEKGLNFPDEYKLVSSVRIPYNNGFNVEFWKPINE